MHVAADGGALLAHDEGDLRVRLEPDDAVGDVDARLLECARPDDVRLLVEARLELDERDDLLPGLRGVEQSPDDGAPGAGRPVEGDLDGEHVGVVGRLLDEGLDRRREGVVGVVHEDVPLTEHREQVGLLAGCGRELGGGDGRHRRELQVRPIEVRQRHEAAEPERRWQHVHVALRDLELADEQLTDLVRHGRLDLEPDGTAESATAQLRLDREQQVVGLLLLHLEVGVAGDAERVVVEDLDTGEEAVEPRGDDRLERHEAGVTGVAGQCDESWQDGRDLDAREALVTVGVTQAHREVERQVRDVGEGVCGIDREGREDGEDEVLEQAVEVCALRRGDLMVADDGDALVLECGEQVGVDEGRLACRELSDHRVDRDELLGRADAVRVVADRLDRDLLVETRDADLEELIEVRGEDRDELHALEQGERRILRDGEHALVELQPRQLAVQEARVVRMPGEDAERLGPSRVRAGRDGSRDEDPGRRRAVRRSGGVVARDGAGDAGPLHACAQPRPPCRPPPPPVVHARQLHVRPSASTCARSACPVRRSPGRARYDGPLNGA